MISAFDIYITLSATYPVVAGAWLQTWKRAKLKEEIIEGVGGLKKLKMLYSLKYYTTSPTIVYIGTTLVPVGGGERRSRWVLDRTVAFMDGTCTPSVYYKCLHPLNGTPIISIIGHNKTKTWQVPKPYPPFWGHPATGLMSLKGKNHVLNAALWRSRPIGFVTVPVIAIGMYLFHHAFHIF